MKKIILSMMLLLALTACKTDNKKNETKEEKKDFKVITALALKDFDTQASNYIDKEVKVTGIVDHVCKHGGKRLFLVSDGADVHIDSDKRFDDKLTGSEVTVNGIVKELRIDEAYCLKQEQDFLQKHKEGVDADEVYEKKMKHIQKYRDSMKTAGVDHLSFYTIDYISHEAVK